MLQVLVTIPDEFLQPLDERLRANLPAMQIKRALDEEDEEEQTQREEDTDHRPAFAKEIEIENAHRAN